MSEQYIPFAISGLVLVASLLSIRLALSVSILEIAMGVIAGNLLHMSSTAWIDFLAGFGGVLLTFLAGAEVDTALFRAKLKESLLIGGFSFLAPFVGALAYCYFVAGWDLKAAEIAGAALSTTSLAVVYAVLVETGLTATEIGKTIMAACFVTDLGTVLALSVLFAQVNWWTLGFVLISAAVIVCAPRLLRWFGNRYGGKVIEPDIKMVFFLLFGLMLVAQLGQSHAVLPVFILGAVLSREFARQRELQRKLRILAFGIITPFFFVKGGMNVSLAALVTSAGLTAILFGVKVAAKFAGVYPLARRYLRKNAMYTTLLMSTGLTFGTISSLYGLQAGYIDKTQFTVLVTVVIATAIIPTAIAQRFFQPRVPLTAQETSPGAQDEPRTASSAGRTGDV
ncbi:MAG: cation:proton antiporter [Thermoleophilia bacterium]|nr:cation:proton antiporter [Thermoleophilia bacterium]